MVMRRVVHRALEELVSISEVPPRREPFSAELYNLTDYLTDAVPRPLPPLETETIDDARIQRRRPTAETVVQPSARSGLRRSEIRQVLSSTAGVRQALVLQEILGPPKSLRPWNDPYR